MGPPTDEQLPGWAQVLAFIAAIALTWGAIFWAFSR